MPEGQEKPLVDIPDKHPNMMTSPLDELGRKEVFARAEREAGQIGPEGDLGTSRCGDVAVAYERAGDFEKAAEYYLMHSPSIPHA